MNRLGLWVAGSLVVACGGTHSTDDAGQAGMASAGESSSGGSSAGTTSQPGGAAALGGNSNGGSAGSTSAGESSTAGAPQGPVAQGAVTFSITEASPAQPGTACPGGTALTVEIPDDVAGLGEGPTDVSYTENVVNGADGASVTCAVRGTSTFNFEGKVSQRAHSLTLKNGTIENGTGTADLTLTDAKHLSSTLSSSQPCVIDVEPAPLQIKPGSMWAHFSCAAVVAPPTDRCAAEGYFVLENCVQE
jgi:hypothetical protein